MLTGACCCGIALCARRHARAERELREQVKAREQEYKAQRAHDAAQRDAATEKRIAEMEKEQHRLLRQQQEQLLAKMEALEAAVVSLRARARERDLVEGERGQSRFTLENGLNRCRTAHFRGPRAARQ